MRAATHGRRQGPDRNLSCGKLCMVYYAGYWFSAPSIKYIMARRQKPPPATGKQDWNSSEGRTPSVPIHEHIGRQLKVLFNEVVDEPVPERFHELLEELARKQEQTKK